MLYTESLSQITQTIYAHLESITKIQPNMNEISSAFSEELCSQVIAEKCSKSNNSHNIC